MPTASPQSVRTAGLAILALLAALGATVGELLRDSRAGPAAAAVPLRLNPNDATAAELDLLPGIGPVRASEIVRFRETSARRPAFRSPDDLQGVRGIGPITVSKISAHLRFAVEIRSEPAYQEAGPPLRSEAETIGRTRDAGAASP